LKDSKSETEIDTVDSAMMESTAECDDYLATIAAYKPQHYHGAGSQAGLGFAYDTTRAS
jgi:hypothetical protein